MLLTKDVVGKGVFSHDFGDGKVYYFFPEEHGLAHILKVHMPSVVSSVRIFTLQLPGDDQHKNIKENPKLFIRIPAKAYEALMKKLFEDELDPKYDRRMKMKDVIVWLGHKIEDEPWQKPEEKEKILQLPSAEREKKHRVQVIITASFVALARPPGHDMFYCHRGIIGSYLGGLPYVDGLTPKDELVAKLKETAVEEKDSSSNNSKPPAAEAAKSAANGEAEPKKPATEPTKETRKQKKDKERKEKKDKARKDPDAKIDPIPAPSGRSYKDIKARALPHYLKQHIEARRTMKLATKDSSEGKDYYNALMDI
jgi:hypothetical protein